MARTGLLLINLGTPDEPTTPAVRRYLREFLSDPRVIDLNAASRWLLLNLVILPTRPARSAEAYRQIWDPARGSPLLYHSRDLAAGVAEALGPDWHVELAMRYGSPSIPSALAAMTAAAVDRIVVLPLFPQYASSSTGTAVARVMELAGQKTNVPALSVVPAFHADPGFLDAFAAVARPGVAGMDHVLFSFHGLPEHHMTASDPTGAHCLRSDGCCDALGEVNRNCYRAQCYATARDLAARLGLAAGTHSVAFQSRLGRRPWIRPYTDLVIPDLARRGARKMAVMCPAFVADCLETLEEIGLRARDLFRTAGGEELRLIPSLNATPGWVAAVASLARGTPRNGRLPLATVGGPG
jgi:protoporphyrin/coproporphyrin ferrochelatase